MIDVGAALILGGCVLRAAMSAGIIRLSTS